MGEKEAEKSLSREDLTRRRRRFSLADKKRMLSEANVPGQSISSVARKYGVTTSLLFRWRKLFHQAVAAHRGATESEVESLRAQVRELQWLLGKKTHENEILRHAMEIAGERRLLSTALSRLGGVQ